MKACLFKLRISDADCLASLRLSFGATVLPVGDILWLRFPEEKIHNFAALPATERYRLEECYLFTLNGKVPVAEMPSGTFRPLADFLTASLPVADLQEYENQPSPSSFRLVRCQEEIKAQFLLCLSQDLYKFVNERAHIVYRDMRYLVNLDYCLVYGEILPSLPGRSYYGVGRMIIPCGHRLLPNLKAEDVDELFPGDGLIFWPSESEGPLYFSAEWTPLSLVSLRLNGVRCE